MVSAPPPYLGGDLEILGKFLRGGPETFEDFLKFTGDLNLGGDLIYRGGPGRYRAENSLCVKNDL